jgi:hypothetical protein
MGNMAYVQQNGTNVHESYAESQEGGAAGFPKALTAMIPPNLLDNFTVDQLVTYLEIMEPLTTNSGSELVLN